MAIEELVDIIPPPSETRFNEDIWRAAEEWIGYSLPKDFRDLAITFEGGFFGDGFLWVPCPDSSLEPYSEFITHQSNVLQEQRDEGTRNIPWAPHPTRPGLLTWGRDENGHLLHWLTEGSSDSWPVVSESHEGEFEKFDQSMTSFLSLAFRNKIRPKHIWYYPIDESELCFFPG